MAGIQAPGVGSNLDINSIVTQLVAAEKAPTEKRLASNEALVQARLSSLGLVKSSLSDFQTAVRSLSVSTAFQSKSVSIANESLFTATVSSAAKPGRYSVEVSNLAQSQKLVSKSFNGSTTTVGTGTLHIEFGSYGSGATTFTANPDLTALDIEIGADKSSLQGIRDAVNAAGAGVTASILNDGTGDRLVFSSESGAKSSMKITVQDGDDNHTDSSSGLSQLAFDPTAVTLVNGNTTPSPILNMTETLAAKDALMKVDGISITRPTNSVTGILPGVTLDLNEMAPGSPTTLIISENKESVKKSVESFVDSYNKLKTVLKDATKYDSQQKKGAVLIGDSAIRAINSQMQHVLGGVIEGVSGQVRALADIGITAARDGTLQLDSAKLGTALNSNIDGFAALFSTAGSSSDSLIDYVKAGPDTKVGQYAVSINQVAQQGRHVAKTPTVMDGNFSIDNGNDTFKIKVDGLQSGLITLTQQFGLSGTALAQEIQSKINSDSLLKESGRSVSVSFDNTTNQLKILSNRYGSDSKIEITQNEGEGSANIGLRKLMPVVEPLINEDSYSYIGTDVSGTIGGFAATGVGTKLTGTGDADGLQINVQGGLTGNRGTVGYSKGVAQQLNSLIDDFLSADGVLTQRIGDFNQRLDAIGESRTKLNQRLTSMEAMLRAQFQAMDLMVGQMKATGDYLTSQFSKSSG